jgi:hypothetical protein
MSVKALLLLLVLLLPGCGIVDVAFNPYAPPSVDQAHNPPPSPPPPPPPPPPINPTGIWDVSSTINGNQVSEVALVANGMYLSLAEMDEFGCGHIAGGNYTVDGSTFTGNGVTSTLSNCGPGYFTWTLSGRMPGAKLNLTFNDAGTLLPTLGANPDPLYDLYGSSLATLVGNWDDGGNVLTVDPDGTFFEQQGNGCTVTGTYTIIDPAHNLYGVSFVFDLVTCTNSIAGIQFTGLAYLTPNSASGWYHLLEDASGVDANGVQVVVFDSLTPYFTPPTG